MISGSVTIGITNTIKIRRSQEGLLLNTKYEVSVDGSHETNNLTTNLRDGNGRDSFF